MAPPDTPHDRKFGVYGAPDPKLADIPDNARQCSPLIPGSAALEDAPEAGLDGMVMAAPPGLQERRHVLALALRALKPGAELIAMAPKKLGGQRLAGDFELLGCSPRITAKSHQKIAHVTRPDDLAAVEAAIEDYGARLDEDLGLWTRPGIFAWNRIDPGTARLAEALPVLSGRGADLGCGLGLLAHQVLTHDAVTSFAMIDIDRRAIEMAWRNVGDTRASVHWADVRDPIEGVSDLDFIVSNPPFHESGEETKGLGQAFIRRASQMLAPGGVLWMVANRHLPYEAVLNEHFASFTMVADEGGYKIIEAKR